MKFWLCLLPSRALPQGGGLAAREHDTPAAVVGPEEMTLGHTGVRSHPQGMALPQTLREEATAGLQEQWSRSAPPWGVTSGARAPQAARLLSLSLPRSPLSSLPVHPRDEDIRARKGWIHWRQELNHQQANPPVSPCSTATALGRHAAGTLDGDHGARKRMISSLDLPEDRFA